MTKKKILKLAPVVIITLLLLMAIVVAFLPNGGSSDFVSDAVPVIFHG